VEDQTLQLVDTCIALRDNKSIDYNLVYQQLKSLLSYGKVDINTRVNSERDPLQFVCLHYKNDNLIDLVKLFVNAKYNSGHTPFYYFCEYYKNHNLFNLVKLLIENEANVNTKDMEGSTILYVIYVCYKNENLIHLALTKKSHMISSDFI